MTVPSESSGAAGHLDLVINRVFETFAKLADGGAVLMPPDSYWFSKKFAWVNDRFGVSWQLNLEA